MKGKRVTIYDIAEEMNVSASTVTRALNGRKGVGDVMRSSIILKAQEMGYQANLIAKSLQREKLRIGVIINDRVRGFHDVVIEGAKFAAKELADLNVEGEYVLLPCVDLRNNIIRQLNRMTDEGVDGVIFVPNEQSEYDDVIAKMVNRGIAVGTVILSYDHPKVAVSVYPDGVRAGRLAADLFNISGLKGGSEILIALGFSYLPNHSRCVEGFRIENEQFGYKAEVLQHYDDAETAYRLTSNYLSELPTIKGIYCSTGVTAPICKAVRDMRREDIVVIGTEITPETKIYFEKGILTAALFQDPFQQGRKAFKAMYDYLEGGKRKELSDIKINPKIVLPGNLGFYEKYVSTGMDT